MKFGNPGLQVADVVPPDALVMFDRACEDLGLEPRCDCDRAPFYWLYVRTGPDGNQVNSLGGTLHVVLYADDSPDSHCGWLEWHDDHWVLASAGGPITYRGPRVHCDVNDR